MLCPRALCGVCVSRARYFTVVSICVLCVSCVAVCRLCVSTASRQAAHVAPMRRPLRTARFFGLGRCGLRAGRTAGRRGVAGALTDRDSALRARSAFEWQQRVQMDPSEAHRSLSNWGQFSGSPRNLASSVGREHTTAPQQPLQWASPHRRCSASSPWRMPPRRSASTTPKPRLGMRRQPSRSPAAC